MKVFILSFLMLSCLRSEAQPGLKIIYRYKDSDVRSCLVCNDSVCYSYMYRSKKDPLRNKTDYATTAKKNFKFYNSLLRYNKHYFNFTSYNSYYIKDTVISKQYQLINEEKIIEGYLCRKALITEKDGNELIVWYTEFFSKTYPYPYLDGIPGVCIEIESLTYGWKLKAVSVTPGDYKVAVSNLVEYIDYYGHFRKYNQK